ncbi:hypothetical protein ASE01_05650 [Nocardioides sp. Root190]|nr:hypothetical protein ASE01_05650 [Nocardioides sp. Root190]
MPIELPSLPEQRRVAAILNYADALRGKRIQVLAHLDILGQSIFQEMFAFGDGWASVPIGELGQVTTGKTPPTAADGMFGGPIPFVTPGDLGSRQAVVRSVTKAGAAASRVVRRGSTFVCCIGATIGKVGAATEPSAFNQQINAVDWGDQIDDAYGFAALKMLKPLIIARGASTTMPLLPKGQFVKIEVPVPPIDLQRAFAERVRAIAGQRELVFTASESDEALFASLQSRAFRGEL